MKVPAASTRVTLVAFMMSSCASMAESRSRTLVEQPQSKSNSTLSFLLAGLPEWINAVTLDSPGEGSLGLGRPGGGLVGNFYLKLVPVCVCLVLKLLC